MLFRVVLMTLVFMPLPSFADTYFFGGVGFSELHHENINKPISFRAGLGDTENGIKNTGYELAVFHSGTTKFSNPTNEFSVNGLLLDAALHARQQRKISFVGRGGLYAVGTESRLEKDELGLGLTAGFAVSLNINSHWSIRGDYDILALVPHGEYDETLHLVHISLVKR